MISTQQEQSILEFCEEVAESNQVKKVQAGEIIVSPGDYAKYVYVIREGLFKLAIKHEELNFTIDFLVPGYITGLVSVFQPVRYPCYIQAVTDSTVFIWERSKIVELMSLIPEIGGQIRKNVGDWGLKAVDRIKTQVFLKPQQRIALWIYEYNQNEMYKKMSVWNKLSEKDMAEYCNVDLPQYTAVISELEENAIVEISEYDCKIKDAEKLRQMIDFSAS